MTFIHASMQFSDSKEQMQHDVDALFDLKADIYTGTEAGGGGGGQNLRAILVKQTKARGYRFTVKGDTWVAVNKDIIKSKWFRTGFVHVIDSSQGTGKHTNKGITWASFKGVDGLGKITVGAGHYLTKGRPDGSFVYRVNVKWNDLYAKAIGKWAKRKGKGEALAFYGGDQNIVDKFSDTFFGEPLTSSWDELKKWQNTGHGNIDVVASYDRDERVSWVSVNALNDKNLFLNTDHYPVKSVAQIELLG